LQGWFLVLVETEFATLPPTIELGTQSVDGASLMVQVPVDRHPLLLLPTLDGRHVPVQVERNLLPGIKPTLGRDLGKRFVEGRFVHWLSCKASGDKRTDCNA
jgi:hypothetical protein